MTMSTSVYDEAFEWYSENWDPDRPVGEWWALLAKAGWSFPSWPEGRGGRGLNPRAAKQAEQARLDAGAYGPPKGLSTFLVAPTLLTYATSEQLDRFMPGIVRVTGQKVWNSGAQNAAFGILMARTDPDLPKHKGISFFLIDMAQEAVDVRPLREMTGDIAFNEVFLSEARVANDDLLGGQGEGWRVGMTTLSHERDPDNSGSGSGFDFAGADLTRTAGEHAAAVDGDVDGFGLAMSGGANRLLDDILSEFDGSADPVRRQRMMQLAELRRTSRWSTARSMAAVKAGGQPGPEVSTLKVIGAEVSRRTRDLGLEAMGPEGMLWGDDTPTGGQFHAYCMFTPAMSIAGGSDEVNRNIIGERVLGLPREPGESEQRQRPWSELPRN